MAPAWEITRLPPLCQHRCASASAPAYAYGGVQGVSKQQVRQTFRGCVNNWGLALLVLIVIVVCDWQRVGNQRGGRGYWMEREAVTFCE